MAAAADRTRTAEPTRRPTFHEFASEWVAGREAEGLAEKTITDLRWSLSNHLLVFFKNHRLSEITPQEIDRYKISKARERQQLDEARTKGEKVHERGLSNNSINHTLSDLSQVLECAVEYGLIAANPASGKRRRLKSTRPSRPWVEPEQLPALLDAAKVDGKAEVGRVLLGVLAGAGLRIGEALTLRWRHVDLPTGTLHIVGSKTAAGVRSVDLTATLREELVLWKAATRYSEPDDYVLTRSSGRKRNPRTSAATFSPLPSRLPTPSWRKTGSPRSRRSRSTVCAELMRLSAVPAAMTSATPPAS